MLGTDQKAWLKDRLSSSTTAWHLLANSLHLVGWADDGTNSDDRDVVYASSPYQRYFDADTNGYLLCDVTKTRWRTTAWAITSRANPNATKFLRTAFEVNRGDPVMRHVGGEAGNPLPDPPPATTPPIPLPL